MDISDKPILVGLVLLIILAIVIGQFALIFWILRKVKGKPSPLSPEQYNFICKIVATFVFSIAAACAIYSTVLLATGVKTTGLVIELRTDRQGKSGPLYAPTFTFVDGSGTTNIADSNFYSSPPEYRVGDRVPIVYRPSNPRGARIDSFTQNWMPAVILSVIGSVALVSMPIYAKWRRLRPIHTTAVAEEQ